MINSTLNTYLDLCTQFYVLDNISTFIAKYELVQENRIIQAEAEEYKIRFYDPEKLLVMLKEAGFSNVNLIKAFDRSRAPDSEDEVIVYECRK